MATATLAPPTRPAAPAGAAPADAAPDADPLPPELRAKLGAIPPGRIVVDPPPGTATPNDADRHRRRTGRLAELIDGTLIEKAVSDLSWWFDGEAYGLLRDFVKPRRLGYVHPGTAYFDLPDGLRAPDASYTPRARRPNGLQTHGYSNVPPALVVEVLSPGNTRQEMTTKRRIYFAAGVELVWELDPLARTVAVWRADTPDPADTLAEGDTLTGEPVLPGFAVDLAELFADPLADPAA